MFARTWVGSTLLFLVNAMALAQGSGSGEGALRDPTVAPLAVSAGSAGDPAGQEATPLGANGTNVVVRNGKPFLVSGLRLIAVGQMVDGYKLERITETEVWLRDASGLTKLPRYAGVQRTAAQVQCPGTTPDAPSTKTSPKPRAGASKPGVSKPAASTDGAPQPLRKNDAHDC